jgi:NitT/TauT family transport system ATP-binding protein
VVQDDVTVDLPDERNQLDTRAHPRFTELRGRVYAEIQAAKRGRVGPSEAAPAQGR